MKRYDGIKLSGEVGISYQREEIWKIIYYLVNMQGKIEPEHLINLYLQYFYSHGQSPRRGSIAEPVTSRTWLQTEGFQYIIEYYKNKISRIDKPIYLKYHSFWSQAFCTYRIWFESQDPSNNWFNIYCDYDVSNYFANLEYNVKPRHPDWNKKWSIYNIGKKKFKNWSDISWRFQSIGMGIPKKESFDNWLNYDRISRRS